MTGTSHVTPAWLTALRLAVAALVVLAVGTELVAAAERGTLANGLSYFTIQSNLIGAAVVTLAAARWRRAPSAVMDWLRGAVVVYLVLTMLIYNVFLGPGQDMSWTNFVVHVSFPLYVVLDWLVDPPVSRIGWDRTLAWLLYPTVFLAYTFVRGAIVDWYPYPFLDLGTRDAAAVAFSIAALYGVGIVIIAAVRLSGEWLGQRRALRASPAAEPIGQP